MTKNVEKKRQIQLLNRIYLKNTNRRDEINFLLPS